MYQDELCNPAREDVMKEARRHVMTFPKVVQLRPYLHIVVLVTLIIREREPLSKRHVCECENLISVVTLVSISFCGVGDKEHCF